MGKTVAETIRETTRAHLEAGGLLFGQCVTAVGWIGGTVPEMSEEEGIKELSMADVAGSGIAVGAALVGRRPIYVIRYQGFMWYNAAPILNYAAKSKDMWDVPCPIFVRALAMEGGIGPVASAAHHGMVMRMPGMPVYAPMTPGEWLEGWDWFMANDDPMYVSEHRRANTLGREMEDRVGRAPDITMLAISAARLNAEEAVDALKEEGISCDLIHVKWLKPFAPNDAMLESVAKSGLGVVIDTDFENASAAKTIAHDLMLASSVPIHVLGLEERTAGFAPHLDNVTPTAERIIAKVRSLLP